MTEIAVHQAPVIHYGLETLAACREGVERLMTAHSEEFTFYRDKKGPVSPDWPLAEALEKLGRLRVFTARHDGEIVGYLMMVTSRSPHYDVKLCLDDTFYLHPDFRAGWGLYNFVKRAVAAMEEFGGPGSAMVVAYKFTQDLWPILKRLGFQKEEIRCTKMV